MQCCNSSVEFHQLTLLKSTKWFCIALQPTKPQLFSDAVSPGQAEVRQWTENAVSHAVIQSLSNFRVEFALEYWHFFPFMKLNISNVFDKMVGENEQCASASW